MKNTILKTLLTFCIAISSLLTVSAKSLTIAATITSLKDSTQVVLIGNKTSEQLAYTFVVNNEFKMDIAVDDEPASYMLYFVSGQSVKYAYIFCGPENITITGDAADMPNALIVTGSIYNEPLEELNKLTGTFEKQKVQIQQQLQQLYSAGKLTDSIRNAYMGVGGKLDKLADEQHKVEKKYIAEHINDQYCVYLLNLYKSNYYTDKELKSLYKELSPEVRKTIYAKTVKEYYSSAVLKPGDKYYNFNALGRNGEVQFSKLFKDDKYVLLVFGSPGCGSSMASMPMQQELNTTMADKLTLAMYYDGSDAETFKEFADVKAYPWMFMYNKLGILDTAYTKYRVGATPTYFLFDKNGRLVETWRSYAEGVTKDKIIKLIK